LPFLVFLSNQDWGSDRTSNSGCFSE
jgi:hypothetical protein